MAESNLSSFDLFGASVAQWVDHGAGQGGGEDGGYGVVQGVISRGRARARQRYCTAPHCTVEPLEMKALAKM